MSQNDQLSTNRKKTLTKGLIISGLFLLLLLPMGMIRGLIRERQQRKMEVVSEIGSKWGLEQQIKGPVLAIHHIKENTVEYKDLDGKPHTRTETYPEVTYLIPENLSVKTRINPSVRSISIFETVIYDADLSMKGGFGDLKDRLSFLKPGSIDWEKTELYIGLSDLRGLKSDSQIKLNGRNLSFSGSGTVDANFGSAVKTEIKTLAENGNLDFEIDFSVKGSERLSFVPLAKQNKFLATSNWSNPGFDGAFLPETHEVKKDGFSAEYSISHLNRNLPETWKKEAKQDYEQAAFGVSLLQLNDNYQKADRSAKYALLVIALTFLSFFFVELLNGLEVHPFQYVLVGVALCLFYVLLVAISEVLLFNYAYLISSLMILGMIWLYAKSVFGAFRLSTLVTVIMTGLYTYVFSIIQLEDRALLVGSLGLFCILALTMYFSRRVDWKCI
ncbi:cell envelope integrity protein CreD [Jiulongibacter sediminis]|jgi:inner membrane protein|uniref:cell envelope integrity protein CreD n=1 Tax=Jiulongibacter sediminis TaxID=1605367 RepID=UPI0026EE1A31|nr:cell envelope integrity protein CreD [Jiulongibacter sediminis]